MRNSLITGGKGFIGSCLVRRLLELGDNVIVIDRSISTLNCVDGATYHNIDLKDFKQILPLFSNIDRVFHLAADISIEYCVQHPQETGMNNSISTMNELVACRLNGVKKFIFSSTSAVYKQQLGKIIYSEEDDTQPLNMYSASKLYGEYLCKVYNYLYGVETVILRYFNVYGNGSFTSPYSSVLVNFLQNKKENKPLLIFGDGTQTRDFINVIDVVDINIKVSETNLIDYQQPYNVGTGQHISIKQLASLISDKIEYTHSKVGELKYSCANVSKLQNILSWKSAYGIQEWIANKAYE